MIAESKIQAFKIYSLFNKENKMIKQSQAQLFTELSSAEASAIAGGAFVTVNSIRAITASSDKDSTDDVKIKVGGKEIWGSYHMESGDFANVARGRRFNSTTKIEVYDDDNWPNPDDFAGSTSIYPWQRGNFTKIVSGEKSKFELNYTITA